MLLWPRLVCGATAVPRSSPGPRLPKPYGRRPLAAPGALFGSPFNVKWRFSAPALSAILEFQWLIVLEVSVHD
jgi:hypothetical protein